jgi:hypothetical protein
MYTNNNNTTLSNIYCITYTYKLKYKNIHHASEINTLNWEYKMTIKIINTYITEQQNDGKLQ